MGDVADPSKESAAPVAPRSLGQVAAGGFVWSFGLTVFAKLIATIGQLVLARLLTQDDYGLFGLATAAAIVPNVIRDAGTVQILVQRRREFDTLANAAFWMSLTIGLAMAGVIALSAPVAAHLYRSPQLIPLGLLLAAASPFNALTIVPAARLQIDLRLRLLAVIGSAGTILTLLLTILFAARGWGAISFALPPLIISVLRVPLFWWVAPVRVTARPEFSRWRSFLSDSGLLIGTAACWAVTAQGDNAILGLFVSSGLVGYYVFAFGLSLQTVQLLGSSVSSVLFPTLSQLNDQPERQRAAFIQACRLSAAVTIPLALLPIACAGPLVHLLFRPSWWPVVPLLQVLSVAAAMATLGFPVGSYLMAQNRNRAGFLYALFMTVLFVIDVTAMTWLATRLGVGRPITTLQPLNLLTPSGPIGTAAAVSLFNVVGAVAGFYLVLSPGGAVWRPTLRIAGVPCLLGAISVAASAMVTRLAGHATQSNVLLILISGVTLLAVYVPLTRIVAPEILEDLVARFRSIVAGRLSRPRGRIEVA